MTDFKNGDIAIAQNGDRGLYCDDSFWWAGSDHPDEDIAFLIRYTDTGAEITKNQESVPDFLPDLEIGSKGLMVLLAQTALKCKGYYLGKLDGDFGKKTYEAVRRFRDDNYLKGDTIIDKQAYQFLFKE